MKPKRTPQEVNHMTIWHFLLFFLTAVLIILVWNLMEVQTAYKTTHISMQQKISEIIPIQYNIPFEKTQLPSTYKAIEKSISMSTTLSNDEFSYSMTRYLEPLPELSPDIKIQDFTEELRFPTQVKFSESSLKAHQGKFFPNDDLQIGSHGSGALEVRDTSIHVIVINIDQAAFTEPIPLYTFSFTSKEIIEEIIIANTLFKVGNYTLQTLNTSFVFTK